MSNTSEKVDFLTVDKEVPGQKYVCLSFLSPEKVIKNKELFMVKHFLQEQNEKVKFNNKKLEEEGKSPEYCYKLYDDIYDEYENFKYRNEEELSKKFDEENSFQTSIRGVKVKGVYSTLEEAQSKAAEFQRKDRSFNIYLGQVGYWLPFDSSAKNIDSIEDQEYMEDQLNELMKSYKKGEVNREIFYEERKQEAMKEALEMNKQRDPWLDKRNEAVLEGGTEGEQLETITEEDKTVVEI